MPARVRFRTVPEIRAWEHRRLASARPALDDSEKRARGLAEAGRVSARVTPLSPFTLSALPSPTPADFGRSSRGGRLLCHPGTLRETRAEAPGRQTTSGPGAAARSQS